MKYAPYFYIGTKAHSESEVEAYLRRKYEGRIKNVDIVQREDLDLVGARPCPHPPTPTPTPPLEAKQR